VHGATRRLSGRYLLVFLLHTRTRLPKVYDGADEVYTKAVWPGDDSDREYRTVRPIRFKITLRCVLKKQSNHGEYLEAELRIQQTVPQKVEECE